MKKVTNGRNYDTDNAMAIAFYECSSNHSSRYYYSERLYMTDNGEFFLHGTGGFLSPYAAKSEDGSKKTGEEIIPMPTEKAKHWIMFHLGCGLRINPHFASIIAALRQ